MSTAIRIFQGQFGRVALLDMDKSLVAHAHSECHVLIKASGADTYFNVRDRSHLLTDRTAVLINAWEPHFYDHKPNAPRTVLIALYIEPKWLAGINRSLFLSARPDFFPSPCVDLSPTTRRHADDLIMTMLSVGELSRDGVESMLFDLMIDIIERFSEWRHMSRLFAPGMVQSSDARIRTAITSIRENVGQPIDMGDLARQCNLSRAHFFSLFRRCTHMTPSVFLNMLRMERACTRLADPGAGTLGRLSEELGFSEQGHFTRFFRQHLGVAPSDYRRIVDLYGAHPPPAALGPGSHIA